MSVSIPCAGTICGFGQVWRDAMRDADRAAVPTHCKRSATKQRARQTPRKSANCARARYINRSYSSIARLELGPVAKILEVPNGLAKYFRG
jgi:hypothetical protein